MSEPLVSIVVPAYNAERYLADAIRSCLAQTWKRTEVIVVDDGSTDATLKVARSLASAKLQVVSAEHHGQSAAINRGLRLAQGVLVKTFDADDVLPPDCIERQVARLQGRDDVVASGTYRSFYRSIVDAEPMATVVSTDMSGYDWLLASLCPDRTAGHSSRLIPRRVLERAGEWDERLSVHNDYEVTTRVLLTVPEVCFTPGAFYYCRSSVPTSLSRRTTAEAIASAELSVSLVVDQLLQFRDDRASRLVCANLMQSFAHRYYAEDFTRARSAMARARELGGADVQPEGALGFQVARRFIGWRMARRLERWAVRRRINRAALRSRVLRSM